MNNRSAHSAQTPNCPQCKAQIQPDRPFCTRCSFDLRYGSIKSPKSGECIYCGENKKFSEGHIFPKWLREYFPLRSQRRVQHLSRPGQPEVLGSPQHWNRITRQGDPYDTVVKNVCETCNNGWMSKLQDQAKPLILALLTKKQITINDESRFILSRWAAMVSVNIQCHARMLYSKPYQLSALINGEMPQGWQIGIAQLPNTKRAGRNANRSLTNPDLIAAEKPVTIVSTFFVIETLVIHSITSSGNGILSIAMLASGLSSFQYQTLEIWPAQPMSTQLTPPMISDQYLVILQTLGA